MNPLLVSAAAMARIKKLGPGFFQPSDKPGVEGYIVAYLPHTPIATYRLPK